METLQDLVREGARRHRVPAGPPHPADVPDPDMALRGPRRARPAGRAAPGRCRPDARRPGHHLGRQPARVGPRVPGGRPRRGRVRAARRPPHRRLRAQGRRPDRCPARPRLPPDGGGRRRSSACPSCSSRSLPDLARLVEPLDAGPDRTRHPRRDRVHERHDRRTQGGDAHPRQPARLRDGDDRGDARRAGRPDALGPAAVAPLRAGPRADRPAARRRQRRLPRQPPAGRAAAHLPGLPRLDPADRPAGPPPARRRHRAQGRPVRQPGALRAAAPARPPRCPGAPGGCCSGPSCASSGAGSTPSGSARRRSRWTSRSAGRTWASTCSRATAPPRWAR